MQAYLRIPWLHPPRGGVDQHEGRPRLPLPRAPQEAAGTDRGGDGEPRELGLTDFFCLKIDFFMHIFHLL